MGASSKIEWTEATWNPVTGCSKISEGCLNCYAERMAKRLVGRAGYPTEKPFAVTFHPERLDQPLRWKKPRRVLVCSMGDLFHEDVPIEWIADVFNVMASWRLSCKKKDCNHEDSGCFQDPGHTFIVLTKRPERMKRAIDYEIAEYIGMNWPGDTALGISMDAGAWPLPNVWLGVTIENQARAAIRRAVYKEVE